MMPDNFEVVTPSGRRAKIAGWRPEENTISIRFLGGADPGTASVLRVRVVGDFNMLSVPGVRESLMRRRAWEASQERRKTRRAQ